MARPFDKNERESIRARLFEAAMSRFPKQGVRRVRVDELCRDAAISKGSFYAFFPSKELLFMEMVQRREAAHRADILKSLEMSGNDAWSAAGALFDRLMDKVQSDPLLNLVIEHGEIDYLMRRTPPEIWQRNARDDQLFLCQLTDMWLKRFPACALNCDVLEGLLALMVALLSRTRILTPTQLDHATHVLRHAFVDQLTSSATSGRHTIS